MTNKHSLPSSWGIQLITVGLILLFLPMNEIIQFLNGDSHLGLFGWAILQCAIGIITIAWGIDVIVYRDKKNPEEN